MDKTTTYRTTDHIYFPEDLRVEWTNLVGGCEAITSSGRKCTHKATHRAKGFQICSQHARSRYTIDVAR